MFLAEQGRIRQSFPHLPMSNQCSRPSQGAAPKATISKMKLVVSNKCNMKYILF